MKLLLIEDDEAIAAYLLKGMRSAGHVVDWVKDGTEGLAAGFESYDVLVIDRMLPSLDGLTIVRSLRGASIKTPVLLLTAMSKIEDRVEGLDAGSDDYLVKPFAFSEFVARVNALVRRSPLAKDITVLGVADLEMNLLERSVSRGGRSIDLLPREFSILEYFMKNEGRILTKTMILERIWNFNFDPQSTVVETHISRLRTKIDKPFEFPLLHTVRNIGYSLHARE